MKQNFPITSCKPLTLILAGLFCSGNAMANAEELYFSDLPIVASVSRLPQRLADAPTAVTVIDRDIIKASGARDLNDVFRLVPGFQTFPHNTESARVTYHGLTDDAFSPRLQVLIDGRSQYSPAFRDGVNWLMLPVAIEDIERIEVVRGTNNVSYGTNAFLGVVNIITVDPALTRGFSVSSNYGNQGVRDYSLRAGGKVGEVGNVRFTYQQKDDDGLADRADWRDDNRTRLFDLRTDLTLTDRDVLETSLGKSTGRNLRGRLVSTGDNLNKTFFNESKPGDPIRNYDQSTTYAQLKWRRVLDANSDFSLRYAYRQDYASEAYVQRQQDTFFDSARVSGKDYLVSIDTGGESKTHELEAQYVGRASEQLRFVGGAGWRWDSLSSPYNFYEKGEVDRNIGRLFSSLEWKPSQYFTGNAGLALERDSVGGNHESPRVSANFHVTPENTVRIGYSKAYRTGSMLDYLGDRRNVAYAREDGTVLSDGDVYRRRFVGNPDLAAEELQTWEIGFLGDWKAQRMSLDVRVFDERIPNRLMEYDVRVDKNSCPANPLCEDRYIGAPPSTAPTEAPEFRVTLPIQSVRTRGLEYQWRWQPLEATRLMLSQAFVNIVATPTTNTDAEGFLPGGQLQLRQNRTAADRALTQDLTEQSSPTHSTSLLIMQKLPYGVDVAVAGYWVGNSRWSRNTSNQGYERYDFRLGKSFKIGGQRGEVAYTAQSINTHSEYQGLSNNSADIFARVVERRQWVSLRLDF